MRSDEEGDVMAVRCLCTNVHRATHADRVEQNTREMPCTTRPCPPAPVPPRRPRAQMNRGHPLPT